MNTEKKEKEMKNKQEKGEKVIRFNSYSPLETIFMAEDGCKWVVRNTKGDRDSDLIVSYYSWYEDHWTLYGSYEAYIVELEGNVLCFQHKQKTDGLNYTTVWKEVILKEEE
jgi:hypothetical protein